MAGGIHANSFGFLVLLSNFSYIHLKKLHEDVIINCMKPDFSEMECKNYEQDSAKSIRRVFHGSASGIICCVSK
jgi:hypothetical protein